MPPGSGYIPARHASRRITYGKCRISHFDDKTKRGRTGSPSTIAAICATIIRRRNPDETADVHSPGPMLVPDVAFATITKRGRMSNVRMKTDFCISTICSVVLLLDPVTASAGPKLTVLYTFENISSGGLVEDAAGHLYGTTSSGILAPDSVFRLTPPSTVASKWTETSLYSFTRSTRGARPEATVIRDANGNLFGTTWTGGAEDDGTVFELSPPATGKKNWTERVLHSFAGGNDGANPHAPLIEDRAGNLYGTTVYGGEQGIGVVFELVKPAAGKTTWVERILSDFGSASNGGNPEAPLIFDASGNLYGTTSNGGVVFELSPANGKSDWAETVLYKFSGGKDGGVPEGALVLDGARNLYGTTFYGGASDAGVVFKLHPPTAHDATWRETVLHSFSGHQAGGNPAASLLLDAAGNLFGTASAGGSYHDGVVFELIPPAPGKDAWSEKILHNFHNDGTLPKTPLIADRSGNLFGTTYDTAFELTNSGFISHKSLP